MPNHRSRNAKSLASKAAELGLAVPQVVAHRVTRMGMAGPTLSERDRKEFQRMVAEKHSAFSEAWSAMAKESVRAHQSLAVSYVRSFWSPSLRAKTSPRSIVAQLQNAAFGVFDKALAPVHRKAVANAKRLARTKVR
jgi:hypothetical protein